MRVAVALPGGFTPVMLDSHRADCGRLRPVLAQVREAIRAADDDLDIGVGGGAGRKRSSLWTQLPSPPAN